MQTSLRNRGLVCAVSVLMVAGCNAEAGGGAVIVGADAAITDDVFAPADASAATEMDVVDVPLAVIDTGVRDTGVRDTGVRDTGVRDTGVRDTGVRDTGVRDTGVRDTGVRDTGGDPMDRYDSARESCVAEINRYRAMLGLVAYERWHAGEECADRMADNDAHTGVAHDGFRRGICSPRGNAQNECPRYGGPERLNGCLAQMWAEGPSPSGEWDLAHGHYYNMLGDFTYMGYTQHFTRVACGFSEGGWMVQNFQ